MIFSADSTIRINDIYTPEQTRVNGGVKTCQRAASQAGYRGIGRVDGRSHAKPSEGLCDALSALTLSGFCFRGSVH
jgi:hypothetical protein